MNYKKQSINTLIQSCKKKNHKAQMELYQRFNRSLYFSAYRIVKNQEDALDAVQEDLTTQIILVNNTSLIFVQTLN